MNPCKKFLALTALLAASLLLPATAAAQDNPVTWSVSTEKVSADTFKIIFRAEVGGDWHMYDIGPYDGGPNPLIFTFDMGADNKATLEGGIKQNTPPTRQFDEMFQMDVAYFTGRAEFEQLIKLSVDVTDVIVTANVEWSVCDDMSCLPPADMDFTVKLSSPENAATGTVTSGTATAGKSLWGAIIEAILWGFAALLTPCVFPMVPMTVSFFLKRNEHSESDDSTPHPAGSGAPAPTSAQAPRPAGAGTSAGTPQPRNPASARGRALASIYGLSIVALYTLPIAVIIIITKAASGDTVTADIFNWLATHWIPNVLFFIVFMLFAASFFGAFEINMPSWLVNKSDRKADRGGLIGTFFMALTLVLVSFSCTGPIVGSVLIKSTSGEVWAPVITMLAFSVAFALPFTLFAFFPSWLKNLPKSGGWLNSVKVVLGFLELALGLKFLSVADQTYHWGILDREIYLALWIVVFTLLGLYLIGKLRFRYDSELKYIGVTRLSLAILTFSFVVYMAPGMWGAPLKGISGYLPPMSTQDFVLAGSSTGSFGGFGQPTATTAAARPTTVKYGDFLKLPHNLDGFFDFDEAVAYAKRTGKPIFLDYTGHGCTNCREMEEKVWSDPRVLATLRNDYIVLALYSDDKKTLPESDWVTTDRGRTLKGLGKINAWFAHRTFGINSQPYYLLLDSDGRPLTPGRGYNLDKDAYLKFLEAGLEAFKSKK